MKRVGINLFFFSSYRNSAEIRTRTTNTVISWENHPIISTRKGNWIYAIFFEMKLSRKKLAKRARQRKAIFFLFTLICFNSFLYKKLTGHQIIQVLELYIYREIHVDVRSSNYHIKYYPGKFAPFFNVVPAHWLHGEKLYENNDY
jgi:hypothetical protein